MAAAPPSALSDPDRLAVLRRLAARQQESSAFDRLARLAAVFLDVPTAMVTFVEEDRQVFAGLALPPDDAPQTEPPRQTPLTWSYCQYVVQSREPLVVHDARMHPELCSHPALTELGVVAYLGVPLITAGGHVIGSFCAIDTVQRSWTDAQVALLQDLAASVMTEVELRLELADRAQVEARLAASEAHYRRLATGIPQAVYVLDVGGRFTELNAGAAYILGQEAEALLGASFASVIGHRSVAPVSGVFHQVITGIADDVEFETWVKRPSGEERLLAATASAIREDGRITGLFGIARDITEERAADRALRESEERFREIADNVREAFWTFTPDFSRMLYMSPAYERIFDRPVQELFDNGHAFLDSVHPDDIAGLRNAMEQVASERVMGVEYRVLGRDGALRWALACGYPVRGPDGEVVRIVGTVEDITERKSAEDAVHDSERQLRGIMNALPVGAVLAEPPGRIVWHNPAADIIWGGMQPASPEAYEHYRGWRTDTGEELGGADWPLARALTHGVDVSDELIDVLTFDGRRRTTLHSAVPLRNASGEVTAALLVVEDVTDARARAAEQRLLAVALEGLTEGICLVTEEGDIVYANATFLRMLGVPEERLAGLRVADFADSPEVAHEMQEQIRHAMEHGRWRGRVRRPRLDGSGTVTLDIVLGRVEQDGARHMLFGIAQDATTEIEREQHLRRAERLASVGTMVSGVAHELNNPLQAILNFAQLLLLEERAEEDRDALTIMVREAQRMAKVVTDLKQIARSTQDSPAEANSADLNEVVQHVVKVQEYRLRTSNVEVRLDLGSDLPMILVDRGQLEQVVLNLVGNAEQAMSSLASGARLILRTRASARGASLHVVDNGHGIPAHQLAHIFDPFFTTKAPGEGTGLGLSLVHSIVAEHGGEIRVDSEIGTGTAFRLDWLRAVEHAAVPVAALEPMASRRSLRVLVVDDEMAVRSVMARYLTRRGHTVEQAADGAAALTMLDNASFDVILSDLRMPGLGGEAMLERLRERGLSGSVVFMTGDAAGAAVRLVEAGIPVLLKPIELTEVARAVEARGGGGPA